jgi:flagellar motor switch protein FliM
MERVLNQEEIDSIVRAARGSNANAQAVRRDVKPCSFRQSGQLTGEQVRAITGLHETFARTLTQSLGAYLRVAFEATLVSVEQLTYCEFLERVPEVTYMVSLHVPQMGTSAGMQIDHSLVFPLVDILLGGNGNCAPLEREVSEIEEQIMADVARIICRELAHTWGPFTLDLELEARQPPAQIQHFLSPTEKTLCLSFELKLAERRGTLILVIPTAISATLLRKLVADRSYEKPRSISHSSRRLAERMLQCKFPVSLGLIGVEVPIENLLTLQAGDVCDLRVPVHNSASLLVVDRECFAAAPVRSGQHRAAQISIDLATREERRQ